LFTVTLTIPDEFASNFIVFLLHQTQVQRCSVANFVISVIKAARKKNIDATLHFGVLLANAKLGKCSHSSRSYNGIL
jgi:hypothetical protein